MKQSYTAVVERAEGLSGPFETEPYEAGWAREAVVFLKLVRLAESGSVAARVQISPDGIDWADEGTTFSSIEGPGLYFVRVGNFGGWLRVAGEVQGSGVDADLLVYMALKE